MARTKQTARRSTGGCAPRRQLATSYNNGGESTQRTQIEIFQNTGKKTIVVDGTCEFTETPDLIYLSFLVERKAPTLKAGIQKVIQKLGEIRTIARTMGVPNESISSDSIASSVEHSEYGYMTKANDKSNDDDSDDYDSEDGDKVFKRTDYRVTHKVKSVLRICLQGEHAASMFSKVCYGIISAGFRTHSAPIYELSNITELRHQAREQACENAKEKAERIVNALKDPKTQLGSPITLSDVHCDLKDDSEDSFLGNFEPSAYTSPRRFIGNPENDDLLKDSDDDDGDDYELIQQTKKPRIEELSKGEDAGAGDDMSLGSFDEAVAEQIFVVPQIHVAACVKAIFEIKSEE